MSSLFERLGGEAAIDAAVDVFYEKVLADPSLAPFFDGVDMDSPNGFSRDEVLGKLGAIDKKALDALLKSLGKKLDKPRVSLLKAELEAHADKRMSPRLWAKEVA